MLEAEIPQNWDAAELDELQVVEEMDRLRSEIDQLKNQNKMVFELIFITFRENGYEELFPGITGPENEARVKYGELFAMYSNKTQSRLFGNQPYARMVPLIDLPNHHNVFTWYQLLCKELQEKVNHKDEESL